MILAGNQVPKWNVQGGPSDDHQDCFQHSFKLVVIRVESGPEKNGHKIAT
jgi:hypothetical protein